MRGRGGRPVNDQGIPLVWNFPEIYALFGLGEVPPRSHPDQWHGCPCPFHAALGIKLEAHPGGATRPAPGVAWFHNLWYCVKVPAFLDMQAEQGRIAAAEAERLKVKVPAPYWTAAAPTQA